MRKDEQSHIRLPVYPSTHRLPQAPLTYRGMSLPFCFATVALLASTPPDAEDAIFDMAADDPVRGPEAL